MVNGAPRAPGRPAGISQRGHRLLIGWLGLLLPLLLCLVAAWRAYPALPAWTVLDSVSAYYYSGAVAIFIGVLASLSLFLGSYRGYEGEQWDKWLGILGGVAAAGIVLFPTSPPPYVEAPPWWRAWMHQAHNASAIVLFLDLFVFAAFVFTQSDAGRWSIRPLEKRTRDVISVVCGVLILVGIAWAAYRTHNDQSIFWQEVISIEGFAISWLIKGGAHQPVMRWYRAMRPGGADAA